jgi:hypothetical protein
MPTTVIDASKQPACVVMLDCPDEEVDALVERYCLATNTETAYMRVGETIDFGDELLIDIRARNFARDTLIVEAVERLASPLKLVPASSRDDASNKPSSRDDGEPNR